MSRPTLIVPKYQTNKQTQNMSNQSIKRPALAIKSVDGHTQFLVPVNNSIKNNLLVVPKIKVINYLKPMKKPSDNSSSVSQLALRSSDSTSSHSASILVHQDTKLARTNPSRTKCRTTTIKLTDKQLKDQFMQCLGLVTKETMIEMQSRKGERKRRTTANPQFSSAALEAKRITKLELAERKAKRRLLTNITNNNNSQLLDNSCESQTKPTMNPIANPRSIGVEPQELLPGVYIVNSIGKSLSANCCVCDELCEYEIDSILFCKPCKALFHATCTVTKNEITEKAILPKCPKCEIARKKSEELLTKKREERGSLMAKKKEMDEHLAQMRRSLTSLKSKLKEKNEEKATLLANHVEVQEKIDKIINTLQLVEDTSEAEDRFDAHLEATAPKPDQTMETNDDEPTEAEMEALNDETCKATEQLEQINKQSSNVSDDMADEENQMYDLQCHENGAQMYDVMVEEVHQTVESSEGEQIYDQHHRRLTDDELPEHQLMLC